jgi:hypothetical protein
MLGVADGIARCKKCCSRLLVSLASSSPSVPSSVYTPAARPEQARHHDHPPNKEMCGSLRRAERRPDAAVDVIVYKAGTRPAIARTSVRTPVP